MREQHVGHALVLDRAHEPIDDLGERERIGREIHGERRERDREIRDGDAREDEREKARALARKEMERERGERRARHGGQGQRQRKPRAEPEIKRDDGAQARARRDADDAGLGQRIAEEALQRRAARAERGADEEREQRARQPDLAHDDGGGALCIRDAEKPLEHVAPGQRHIARRKRDEKQKRERGEKREIKRSRSARVRVSLPSITPLPKRLAFARRFDLPLEGGGEGKVSR